MGQDRWAGGEPGPWPRGAACGPPYPEPCGHLEETGPAGSLCPCVGSAVEKAGDPGLSSLEDGCHRGTVFQWAEGVPATRGPIT